MTFRKRTARGKTLSQKGFPPGPPFPKTPKWLRSGHDPATGSLARTRPVGGRFLTGKSPLDSLRSKRNNSLVKIPSTGII